MAKDRISLDDAKALAEDAVALLSPACERIEVAGSIRRGSIDVGDIEIVCVPKVYYAMDMFGLQMNVTFNELDALCTKLVTAGRIERRYDERGVHAWGSRFKRALLNSRCTTFALDIFAVLPPAQWGVVFAIRTGPGDFSRALVTDRQHGGSKPTAYKITGGALYDGVGQLIDTPEETDFFAALGLPFIPPEERTTAHLWKITREL